MTLEKSELFAAHLPEEEMETRAGTIRIRGLSRAEVMKLKDLSHDLDALDARMLELALVEPKLSKDEVQKWREAWPHNDFEDIIAKITSLSGMNTEEEEEEAKFRPGLGASV